MNLDYMKIYEDVKVLLEGVSAKIGEGAEYAWTAVVTQQYAIGISNLIWSLFGIGVAVLFSVISYRCWKKQLTITDRYDSGGWGALGVFTLFISVGCTAIAFACITSGVMHIINPHYYALEFFINMVKPGAVPAQ